MINIFAGKNQPGMLVSVLEAFEDIGLNVLEARISCTDSFSLHANGVEVINTSAEKHIYIHQFYIVVITICLYAYICIEYYRRSHVAIASSYVVVMKSYMVLLTNVNVCAFANESFQIIVDNAGGNLNKHGYKIYINIVCVHI